MYLACFWSLVQENVILRLLHFVITANRACWYKGMRPVKYWINWFIYRQRYRTSVFVFPIKNLPCFVSEHRSTKQMKGPAYTQHTVLTVDLPTWTIQLSKVIPSQPPMLWFYLYAALKNHIWLSTFFCSFKICRKQILNDTIHLSTPYPIRNAEDHLHKRVPSRLLCSRFSQKNIRCSFSYKDNNMVPFKSAIISCKFSTSQPYTPRFIQDLKDH